MNKSPRSPRKKVPKLTQIHRPNLCYYVQSAFASLGVYFIDPSTHEYVNGLLNTSALYLTLIPPPVKRKKHPLGFIPRPTEEKSACPDCMQAEASLFFSYTGDDLFSGVDEETGVTHLIIQVWHDDEVEKWEKIAQKAARKLGHFEEDKFVAPVFFTLTSTFVPFDPNAPHHIILSPPDSDDTYAVSDTVIPQSEDEYEDSECDDGDE